MPVRPEERVRYPIHWPAISEWVKSVRAQGRCECAGECGRALSHLAADGRCRNHQGRPRWGDAHTQCLVVLSTAHLDHTPENNDPNNLLAVCEGCHLSLDRAHHWHTRREREYAEMGILPLFDLDTLAPTEDGEPACV